VSKHHPQHVDGRFRRLKNVLSVFLQALLFVTPWLTWNGQPLAQIDLQGRRLHLLGATFWPQETHLLLLLLMAAGITLFLVSATLGRIWCGFACPQTLFSHSFILVERLIEGDAYKRARLDAKPWSEKWPKKLAKTTIWLVMSIYLGITFAGYFAPIREVVEGVLTGHPSPFSAGLILFFTAVSMAFFGHIRGSFCTSICPYARFQSAMTTADTRMVSYDTRRGEPRGKVNDAAAKDCVDCKACVRVCPMGIDIRDGFQFECINCASCIDACDDVMVSLGRAPGLISFTSMEELQARERAARHKSLLTWLKGLGPRPFIYLTMLAAVAGLLGYFTSTRSPYDLEIVREATGTAVTRSFDGRTTNRYLLRIIHRGSQADRVTVTLDEAPEGAELVMTENPLELAPDSISSIHTLVLCPSRPHATVVPITFCITGEGGSVTRKTTFAFGGH
jgi:cytochrome c oxidase accessory protein FixG